MRRAAQARATGRWLVLALVLLALLTPAAFAFGQPLLAAVTGHGGDGQGGAAGGSSGSNGAGSADASAPTASPMPTALSPLPGIGAVNPDALVPNKDAVAAKLNQILKLKSAGQFAATVTDLASGAVLYGKDSAKPVTPASNLKLLTALSVLDSRDASETLKTRVLTADTRVGKPLEDAPGAGPNDGAAKNDGDPTPLSTEAEPGAPKSTNPPIVLTAGGDTMLGAGKSAPDSVMGRAGLQSLAEDTVKALADAHVQGSVPLELDDTLFQGAQISPAWDPGDVKAGEVAGIYPIAVNAAQNPRDPGKRPTDAAMDAAKTFQDALTAAGKAQGLRFDGPIVRVSKPFARPGAREVAAVESAPLYEQVGYTLEESDNFLAEVMGRLAAIGQGKVPSFAGAIQAVQATLASYKLDTQGEDLEDVSGLSPNNKITTAQLDQVLTAILSSDNPSVRTIIPGLPVAGQTGSLADRFLAKDAQAARGLAHAKTGTLNSVASLTGYLIDADGRVLTYSIVANGLKNNVDEARNILDLAVASLAECGCRK